jgi:hypothetical protein
LSIISVLAEYRPTCRNLALSSRTMRYPEHEPLKEQTSKYPKANSMSLAITLPTAILETILTRLAAIFPADAGADLTTQAGSTALGAFPTITARRLPKPTNPRANTF